MPQLYKLDITSYLLMQGSEPTFEARPIAAPLRQSKLAGRAVASA